MVLRVRNKAEIFHRNLSSNSVTCLIECIQEAWTHNHLHPRNSLQGDIDTFRFLSSSFSSGSIPLSIRMQQARSYMKTTAILFSMKIKLLIQIFLRIVHQTFYYQSIYLTLVLSIHKYGHLHNAFN